LKRKPGFKPGAAKAVQEPAFVGAFELVLPDTEDGPAAGAATIEDTGLALAGFGCLEIGEANRPLPHGRHKR
jgi:hypothetical protein